jgi:chromosome segregation ATPase
MFINVDADDEDEQKVERMSSPGHTAGYKRDHNEIDEDDADSGPEPKRLRANSNASQASTICSSPSMKDEHDDAEQGKGLDDEVEEEEAEVTEEEEEEEEKRDIMKPTKHDKDTTAKLESHIANLDGLVAQERSRANKLQKRYDSLIQAAHELDLSNKTMSSQLREAQAEVNRLRAERSTLALLNPQSDKTEEECLRLLKRLNQKIKDLSSHIATISQADADPQTTRKERREYWRSILVDVLRRVVFDKFLAGLSKTDNRVMMTLSEKIPEQCEFDNDIFVSVSGSANSRSLSLS